MKKESPILFFVVLSLWHTPLFGQNTQAEQALKTFKPIVTKFSEFFKTNPKLIAKDFRTYSPTGLLYSIREYRFVDISYNVEKTNSIVSPFVGYLEVIVTDRDNDSCGNVKTEFGIYGWDNVDDTLRNDIEQCFSWRSKKLYIEKSEPQAMKFVFAYQDGKWVFKDVILQGKSFEMMLAALSKATTKRPNITESAALAYNRKWVDLLTRTLGE